jgi:CheY-like chemotaxis protein
MLDKRTILVIEDDKHISHFIDVSLSKDNYNVLTAETAAEGMFLFSSHRPDIILLDLGLPDRDGTELLRGAQNFFRYAGSDCIGAVVRKRRNCRTLDIARPKMILSSKKPFLYG